MRAKYFHQNHIDKLTQMLAENPGFCLLSGAGISAESGLPTYRDKKGEWAHSKPMQHVEFINSESRRKFYWARSLQGWPVFRAAQPGLSHVEIEMLHESKFLSAVVTQNVDRLHQNAGTLTALDLHGRLDQVICLSCDSVFDRDDIQSLLMALNPGFTIQSSLLRPDGDVEIDLSEVDNFNVPVCEKCDGLLKPNVVFFGDVLDKSVVKNAISSVSESSGLIVAGSSLMVYSGLRYVKQAVEEGKPVVLLNQGITRGDQYASLKVDLPAGPVLNELRLALGIANT